MRDFKTHSRSRPLPRLVLITALVLGALIKCYSSGGFANVTNACKDVAAQRVGEQSIVGTVTKVSDGDTIWVTAHGNRVKVRMDRIDAPESNQAYGKAARQFLADRIMGKDVEVRYTKTDRYGRVLGIVYLNGEDINLLMVREGMAWHYSHFDKTPAYAQAHEAARAAKRGLWADPNTINPYDWRKRK